MAEEINVKKVFKNTPEGKRCAGKPRNRWLEGVENDVKKLGVRGWRKIVKDGDAWKLIQKDARFLRGQWRRWKERAVSQI
jgi:hypothetical protein